MLRTWLTIGPDHRLWPRPGLWVFEAETETGPCHGRVIVALTPEEYPVGCRYLTAPNSYVGTLAALRKEKRRWIFLTEDEAAVYLLGCHG